MFNAQGNPVLRKVSKCLVFMEDLKLYTSRESSVFVLRKIRRSRALPVSTSGSPRAMMHIPLSYTRLHSRLYPLRYTDILWLSLVNNCWPYERSIRKEGAL